MDKITVVPQEDRTNGSIDQYFLTEGCYK
jgi:hypothetical protein